ncbi:uncharacterized protein LOC133284843 [Gastrolobium bilobum]|uniref:uncharacterized protein LOC133284843 n=1 Tax=Gastrolobium bilobum TaxID=150636 RepID=UPI002AB2F6EB|nr:uncharacterized protein LOC133284843 [Gastrolobium bilobum]
MDAVRQENRNAREDVLEANRLTNMTMMRVMLEEMRAGRNKGQFPPPPPPPNLHDDSQSHTEGSSQRTGVIEPYHEPVEDRDVIDRRLNAFCKDKPLSFDGKFAGKGKRKQLAARQAPSQFKRTSTPGSTTRPSTPRCSGCGKFHVGSCATGKLISFQSGQAGHYSRDCPSSTARAAAV